MITVIAPHARPEFASNLLANFHRQRGVAARLLVVENGAAVGGSWPSDVMVLRSAPHQAAAMNVALAVARGAWARFDDDDYYGPDYLADVARDLERHPIVGKTWGFVLYDDGLFRHGGVERASALLLAGGTLSARTPDVAPFQHRDDDDLQWCRDMRERGTALWAGDHRGYCYDRRSNRSGAPRVITSEPLVTRWGFGGDTEYFGMVGPEHVDMAREPVSRVPSPTGEDLAAESLQKGSSTPPLPSGNHMNDKQNHDRFIIVPEPVRMHNLDGEPMFDVLRDRYGKPMMTSALDEQGNPTRSPEPILVPWITDYRKFINERLADPKTGQSVANILLAASIRNSLRDLLPGAVWRLKGDEYEYLADLLESPTAQHDANGKALPAYNSVVAVNLAEYFHVTLSASTSPPAVATLASAAE